MIIDPKNQPFKDNYKLLIGSILPRPIAFVSTISGDGIFNVAPFSLFTAISSQPPTIAFAPNRRGTDGTTKDTLNNIKETKEFVVNMVTEEIIEAVNNAASDFPPQVDEFAEIGLTATPAQMVKAPLVAESPIHFECKLYDIIEIGPAGPGGGALVIGEVVLFHVDDDLLSQGRIDTGKLKPVASLIA